MATNISGIWTAVLSGGRTVYTSGKVTSNGPVNLVGSSTKLYVSSGAIVSGMTDTPAGDGADWPNVYVSSGGSVISSTLVNVDIYVSAGASAVGNSYNRARDYLSAGGSSINETFYGTGTGGAVAALVLQGGTAVNLTLSSGGRLIAKGGVAPGTISGTGGTVSGLTVQSGGIAYGSSTLNLIGTITNAGVISGGVLQGAATRETLLSGGSSYQQIISSGAELNVSSGATASATTISTGALLTTSGAVDNAMLAGGKLLLDSPSAVLYNYGGTFTNPQGTLAAVNGGSIGNLVVNSGFNIVASSGGKVNGFTLSGGTLEIQSGSVVGGNTISGGGTLFLDSGVTWNASGSSVSGATSGGTIVVSNGATLTNTPVLSGGSAFVNSGAQIAGTTTVNSGGTLVMNGTAGNGVVNLAGDGSQLTISGTSMPTNVISGWSNTDRIDFASVPKSSVTGYSTSGNTLTLKTTNGNYTLNIPGVSNLGSQILDDGHGDTVYTTCFATGTMIATPDGEIAVEAILPGALVQTPQGPMPVKWLGHRAIDVNSMAAPEDNWLVRIKADALADGVPARDLLVTQEHCMVFEGKLVPARMLVNGASIMIDRSIASYTYYHVELDSHEALWAEGALTESYLDTGNRDQFSNATIAAIFPARGTAVGGSETLPLDTSRAFVEPLHTRFAERASTRGMTIAAAPVTLTHDCGLFLTTDAGEVLPMARRKDNLWLFQIPAGVKHVTLHSHTFRPSESEGPFVDDRRTLGVLIGNVTLFDGDATRAIDTHLSASQADGWSVIEQAPCRWTTGDATLSLGIRDEQSHGLLAVMVLAGGPYQVGHLESAKQAHSAAA